MAFDNLNKCVTGARCKPAIDSTAAGMDDGAKWSEWLSIPKEMHHSQTNRHSIAHWGEWLLIARGNTTGAARAGEPSAQWQG